MSQLALSRSHWIRTRPPARRRKSYWQEAKGSRLTLRPVETTESTSQWPTIEEQCKTATADISPGYKRAIALLRSLRNVKPEEIEKKRESYDLLVQVMNEDRYH